MATPDADTTTEKEATMVKTPSGSTMVTLDADAPKEKTPIGTVPPLVRWD